MYARNLQSLKDKFPCQCASLAPCVFNTESMTTDSISNLAVELLGVPIYITSSKLKKFYHELNKNIVSKTLMVELLLMAN